MRNNRRMKKLKLSKDLTIPIDVVTQRVSILGRTGSGKSHTAGVLVEEALKAGQQVVVSDPKGDWWGLRASADGKSAGLPITIMGGEHGDLPLEPTAGALVADIVINEGISVILDLSLFESKAQEIKFMEAFADRLYRKNKRPLLFVSDEADIFAPQRPEKNETLVLNRMETLCRRGRSKGIGVVLISQRSASLHKGCLSQTELMIAHQTTAPQDKKAVEYWVVDHGDEAQRDHFMGRISKLPVGTAIAWSPSWLNLYEETAIRAKETYDSSATPKVGMRRRAPKVLAPVDLARLKSHMAETLEKMKQEDPKLLREEIKRLQWEITGMKTAKSIQPVVTKAFKAIAAAPKIVEKPVILKADISKLDKLFAESTILASKLESSMGEYAERLVKLAGRITEAMKPAPLVIQDIPKPPKKEIVFGPGSKLCNKCHQIEANCRCKAVAPAQAANGDFKPLKGEREIMNALACFAPRMLTRTQLGVLLQIKPGGTTLQTYVNRLKRQGLIGSQGEDFHLTKEGLTAVGGIPPEPITGEKIKAMWMGKLLAGERKILEYAISEYPNPVLDPGAVLGINPKGTTVQTYVNRLVRCGLLVKTSGGVAASDDLFMEGARA